MSVVSMFVGNDRDASRLEAFSDGVIAIAITLLILDVKVPRLDELEGESLWHALAHLWPSYLGYGLSFLVIGIMWANHHAIFKHIARVDHYLLLLNLLLLFSIAFLPFPTALLSEYLTHEGERTAVIVYAGWSFGAAICFYLLWQYVRRRDLIDPGTDLRAVDVITRRFRLGPPSYLVAFGLAFIYPPASLAMLAILALLYVLPDSAPI